jgi:hypothetical protein
MRITLILLILLIAAGDATAQVEVHRRGEENPMVTIAKATMWGGVAGLILGGAVALVADDNQGDIIKWSLVGGVFFGFGFGVYHVLTRPEPTGALLEFDRGGFALAMPTVNVGVERIPGLDDAKLRGRVSLVSYNF